MIKEIEIAFRKFLLKLLLLFYGGKEETGDVNPSEEQTCFVIRLNRIGDALITTPLLKLLKEKCGFRVIVLADKRNHKVFENTPHVDDVVVFQKGLKGFKEIRKYFKRNRINVLIDSHDDVSTTVSFITGFSGAGKRFALEKENKNIFTQTIARKDPTKYHVAERVAEIAKLCGAEFTKEEIRLIYVPQNDSLEVANNFINEYFKNERPVIGINISAGSDARFWGVEKYSQTVEFIKSNFDVNLLIIRTPEDKEKAAKISSDVIPIFNDKSFDQFAAMISKLDLLITPDTSAVHLASAFGVPVFGIYVHYKTEDVIWYPFNDVYEAVITREPNLSNLTVEQATAKFEPFIKKLFPNSAVKNER